MMVSILDQNSLDDIIEQVNQLESDPGLKSSRSLDHVKKARTTLSLLLLRKGRPP